MTITPFMQLFGIHVQTPKLVMFHTNAFHSLYPTEWRGRGGKGWGAEVLHVLFTDVNMYNRNTVVI